MISYSRSRRGSIVLEALVVVGVLTVVALLLATGSEVLDEYEAVEETITDFLSLESAIRSSRRENPTQPISIQTLKAKRPDMVSIDSSSIGINSDGYGYEVRNESKHIVLSAQFDSEATSARVSHQLGDDILSRFYARSGGWVVEYWIPDNPSLAEVVEQKSYDRDSSGSNQMATELGFSSNTHVVIGDICEPDDGVQSGGISLTSSGQLVSCRIVTGESHRKWQLVSGRSDPPDPPQPPPLVIDPPKPPVIPPKVDPPTQPITYLCPDNVSYVTDLKDCPIEQLCDDGTTWVYDKSLCPLKQLCADGYTQVYDQSRCPNKQLCSDGQTEVYDTSFCPQKQLCSDGQTEVFDTSHCPKKQVCSDGITEVYDTSLCPKAINCWDGSTVYPPQQCPQQTYTCSDPSKTVVLDLNQCPQLCSDNTTWKVDQKDCPSPITCWNNIVVYSAADCPPKTHQCSDPGKTVVTDPSLCPTLCQDGVTWTDNVSTCPTLCADGSTWQVDPTQCPQGTTCWDKTIVYPPAKCPVQPIKCWDGSTVTPPEQCRIQLNCNPPYVQRNIEGGEQCVCLQSDPSCSGPGNYCGNPVTIVVNPGGEGGQTIYVVCKDGGEVGWY